MEAYKERMINEYNELIDRIDKLSTIIVKAENRKLEFELSCPLELLKVQLNVMKQYRDILIQRATIEHVELGG